MVILKDEEIFILESLDRGSNDLYHKYEREHLEKHLLFLDNKGIISIPVKKLHVIETLNPEEIELTSYGRTILRRRKFENQ